MLAVYGKTHQVGVHEKDCKHSICCPGVSCLHYVVRDIKQVLMEQDSNYLHTISSSPRNVE